MAAGPRLSTLLFGCSWSDRGDRYLAAKLRLPKPIPVSPLSFSLSQFICPGLHPTTQASSDSPGRHTADPMADITRLKARTRADYPYLLEYRTRW